MSEGPVSGNRWEPPSSPTSAGDRQGRPDPVAGPPIQGPGWRTRRGAGLLAGVASVCLLGGGVGGYALGHATWVAPVADPSGGRPGLGSTGDGPGVRPGPGFRSDDGDGDGDGPGDGPGDRSGRRT